MQLSIKNILHSDFMQNLLSSFVAVYLQFVYYSSRKSFINQELLFKIFKEKKPVIFVCWHSRLLAGAFIIKLIKKSGYNYDFYVLASKHGDGQFIARLIEKFGGKVIYGSSQRNRGAGRGIDIANFKKIFSVLKKGNGFAITPDGPRGPKQKINSEILNIAKISGVEIMVGSYSSSRHIKLNSWDQFMIPLPFSRICYYAADELIKINRNDDEKKIAQMNKLLEEKINFITYKSDREIGL